MVSMSNPPQIPGLLVKPAGHRETVRKFELPETFHASQMPQPDIADLRRKGQGSEMRQPIQPFHMCQTGVGDRA